ncbi:MAG: 3-phosphoshikimate 1-carboxyvinyltransferase [Acidobacteria bacterium]|nr:3-phosphoshikimate 1-carboxyvinyltransferase [Acidobacteriota bacterium]
MLFDWQGDQVRVHPSHGVDAVVAVPGSKSLTNRWLMLAGLAKGQSTLRQPLLSEDTELMTGVLRACGVSIETTNDVWTVVGNGILKQPDIPLFVGNAGTVMRFVTPVLSAFPIAFTIGGTDRMALRPIGDLVDALRVLGVKVSYLKQEGYPPLSVAGPIQARSVALRGDRSSQYLSGLLMALPLVGGGTIELSSQLVSRSYVEMTLACMARFGVQVTVPDAFDVFEVPAGHYMAQEIAVDGDASSASYWFGLPLMLGSASVRVTNVHRDSHQGDMGLIDVLAQMGAEVRAHETGITVKASQLKGVEVDMTTMSDVAPTLMVIATRASSPTTITGIGHIRIKECDRIATMQRAFDQLGLRMESGPDWVKVWPGRVKTPAVLDPQEDHRMAMCFALLGLADGGVTIQDGHCVDKTYPTFYNELTEILGRA